MAPTYEIYPSVDENYNFPPEVRQAIANSDEIKTAINSGVVSQSSGGTLAFVNDLSEIEPGTPADTLVVKRSSQA